MPLLPNILFNELDRLLNSESPNFIGFPDSNVEVASNWANAIGEYAKSVIIPCADIEGAKLAMKSTLIPMDFTNGLILLPTSFTAFAAVMALAMTTPAFSSIPPPVPIDFNSVWSIPTVENTNSARVTAMTTVIDLWFRTGTYIQLQSGVVSPWT